MKLLNWLIKKLCVLKLRIDDTWLGTSYGVDEFTDIHILVETWRDGNHWYGTVETHGLPK